jgi:hypothetical protein
MVNEWYSAFHYYFPGGIDCGGVGGGVWLTPWSGGNLPSAAALLVRLLTVTRSIMAY